MTRRKAAPQDRTVTYRPLADLHVNPRNPKAHNDVLVAESLDRFGVVDPIVVDSRTDWIVSGHGRLKALNALEAGGGTPPEGIRVEDGVWQVPVMTGWASANDREASAALIALNRTTELGGWVDADLLGLLADLEASGTSMAGIGFTDDDMDALRESLDGMLDEPFNPADPKYTMKTDIPQYEPTQDAPPPLDDLLNMGKVNELLAAIEAAEIPADVAAFLGVAAMRHAVFTYSNVAEYYAHASPEVQKLMEDSALVIIDSEDAIRNGFLVLSAQMEEIRERDAATREEQKQ